MQAIVPEHSTFVKKSLFQNIAKENTSEMSVDILYSSNVNSQFGLSVIVSALDLLQKVCSTHSQINVSSLPEQFAPVKQTLESVKGFFVKPHKLISPKLDQLVDYIQKQMYKAVQFRKPLEWLTIKPVELPTYEPLVYAGRLAGRILDPDQQRLKHKILQSKVKRESRAAVRELRRDNFFMRKAREQDASRISLEQKQKYKRAINDIQSDVNSMQKHDYKQFKVQRAIKEEHKQRKRKRE